MSYNIKTVSELTGIPRNTLLAWERRYDLLAPDRGDNNYRLYSEEDVEYLLRLKELMDRGHRVGEAIRLLRQRSLVQNQVPALASGVSATETLMEAILGSLLDFDRAGAEKLCAQLVTVPYGARLDEVFLPMLCRVGDAWENGDVNVAQEHYVSAFCREQMLGMLSALGSGPSTGRTVMLAGAAGEDHEFGLLAVAIKLAMTGQKVLYFGANLPFEEVVGIVTERRPSVLCQSLIRRRPKADLLTLAHNLRRAIPSDTLIAWGGSAVVELADQSTPGMVFCRNFEDLVDQLR